MNSHTFQGEHKQPAHLARQPFGQIPALEDVDGTKVFESRAILRYLVHAYPKQAEKIVPKVQCTSTLCLLSRH